MDLKAEEDQSVVWQKGITMSKKARSFKSMEKYWDNHPQAQLPQPSKIMNLVQSVVSASQHSSN